MRKRQYPSCSSQSPNQIDWKHEKRSPKTAQQIKIKATPPPPFSHLHCNKINHPTEHKSIPPLFATIQSMRQSNESGTSWIKKRLSSENLTQELLWSWEAPGRMRTTRFMPRSVQAYTNRMRDFYVGVLRYMTFKF